jgi:outer membrane lipoprotein SlyB
MTTVRVMKSIAAIAGLWVAAGLTGCAPSLSGNTYSRDQVRQEQSVRTGIVEGVREIQIEGTRSGIGPAAGGVVGGIAGSTVGAGRGSAVGAVLGAVAGGIAGQAAEQVGTRKNGVEVTVLLDNGGLIAITQEAANDNFRPGDRVRVLSGGGASRVTHASR